MQKMIMDEKISTPKIGVISDSHDNMDAIKKAVKFFNENDVELVIHAGDIVSPFTAEEFKRLRCDMLLIYGNNDGDKLAIGRNAAKYEKIILHGEMAEIELGGRTIAMTHYPHIAKALAYGEHYDLVCYGHNHTRAKEWVGRTLFLNPGEVMGRFGVSSCAIYDTVRGDAHIVEV